MSRREESYRPSIKAKAVDRFVKFIEARERHRRVKEGETKWKNYKMKADPIISQYRFCNVRRNDDRVTLWVHAAYLDRWRENKDLWFALLVARLFNNEDTLEAIRKFVLPFKPEDMRRALKTRAADGKKNFNAAYIVSTNGRAMDKVDYVIDNVLAPAWADRGHVSSLIANVDTLDSVHRELSRLNGCASFMAGQVVADLKYANPSRWGDFHTFAASGPGSKRGLNCVMGRDVNAPWREEEFRVVLDVLRDMTNARLTMEPLTAQDIQNCLCEYFKYAKVGMGIGKPKQLYKPRK